MGYWVNVWGLLSLRGLKSLGGLVYLSGIDSMIGLINMRDLVNMLEYSIYGRFINYRRWNKFCEVWWICEV